MALIVKHGDMSILSEEKNLRKPGWYSEGKDVFTRCVHCKKIIRVRLRQDFRDGCLSCIQCQRCSWTHMYIFAGLNQNRRPRFTAHGTFEAEFSDTGCCAKRVAGKGCPCGGTIVRVADYSGQKRHYCLSCHKPQRMI